MALDERFSKEHSQRITEVNRLHPLGNMNFCSSPIIIHPVGTNQQRRPQSYTASIAKSDTNIGFSIDTIHLTNFNY